MLNQINHTSYNIVSLDNDRFQILASGKHQFEGTLSEIFRFLVVKLKIQPKEVEDALIEMHQKGHQVAEFGTYRTFMFTMTREQAKLVS